MFERFMKSNYVITGIHNGALVITDIGPWDKYLTVTNNAEAVVQELWNKGFLSDGMGNQRRLFYFDSESSLLERK